MEDGDAAHLRHRAGPTILLRKGRTERAAVPQESIRSVVASLQTTQPDSPAALQLEDSGIAFDVLGDLDDSFVLEWVGTLA